MKPSKVVIVGCGSIGTAIAWALLTRRELELVFINRNEQKAWAKAFDMSHCLAELPNRTIHAEAAEHCQNADIIVMTAGALPRENGTRADVLKDNVNIFKSLLPVLGANNPNAVLLNITNPVDAMAYAAGKIAGLPARQVIGSGTELDSMRLRHFTAAALSLDEQFLDIPIIGEHGDSMVPLWSQATYHGIPLATHSPALNEEMKASLMHQTRRAGWDIRLAGEHSCYGIAFSAVRIIETILGYSKAPIRVSSESSTQPGTSTFISGLTYLDRHGVCQVQAPVMNAAEQTQLEQSSQIVTEQLRAVNQLLDR